jgi:hypothetical protein
MKHTNEIYGWFNYSKLYDKLVQSIPDNGIFVECGAWLGKSSSYLCDIAQDRIQIYIVDHWQGSPEETNSMHKLAQETDVYKLFLDNMGNRNFIPLKMNSIEASKQFQDNSCDVVYIDMDHSYEAVKQDILHWLPKVKNNGFLAGHDYDWPGVKRAVDELFESNILIEGTSWIVRKIN